MPEIDDEGASALRRKAVQTALLAFLLATLAWIDGRQLDTTGRIVVGRERSVLEGLAAEALVVGLVVGAVACGLHALALAARSRR